MVIIWKKHAIKQRKRTKSMKTTLTLLTGGARSGKSSYALNLVEPSDHVLFVATAQAFDEDMAYRIANHKLERPAHWGTLEAPQNIGAALLKNDYPADTIIIDCLTMLTSNIILSLGDDVDTPTAEQAVRQEVDALLAAYKSKKANLIVVTNEVGLGIVPAYKLGRIYRDALGRANQQIAAVADRVLFMVSGYPMVVKGEI